MALTHHWVCESPKRAILVIHGMTEHLGCYDVFAAWCGARNVVVAGGDLPGHGAKAAETGVLGDPGAHGWDMMVDAAYLSFEALRALYPGIPLVVLGHSMGSYIAQAMVAKYRPDIQGLVLSATSYEPRYVTGPSWVLAKVVGFFGETRPGRFFYNIIYGGFNKPFQPAKTPFDWLSRDSEFVVRYMKDPLCAFVPTVRLYLALFSGLYRLYWEGLSVFPDTPMYVFSGYEDPLGKRLRSVMSVVGYHREAGRRVDTSFYPGGRHVMLAETNATEVYEDLYHWLFTKVG